MYIIDTISSLTAHLLMQTLLCDQTKSAEPSEWSKLNCYTRAVDRQDKYNAGEAFTFETNSLEGSGRLV